MPKLVVQAVPNLTSFTVDGHLGIIRMGSRMNIEQDYSRRKGGSVSVTTFAWDIQNGYATITKDGGRAIRQRNGITKFNSTQKGSAEKFRGLFEVEFSGTKYVIARTGTSWSQYDEVDSFDDISGATGRASDPVSCSVTQFVDSSGNVIFVLADGGALLKFKSDLSAAALGGSPLATSVDAVHTHQHKLWYNDLDNPMHAHYTAVNNGEDHSKTGDAGTLKFEQILPQRDTLLGFSTLAEVYLVFHFRNSQVIYYAGTEPSEFTIQQIVPIKCYSFGGIAAMKRDLAIPADEGLNSLSSAIVHQAAETDDLTRKVPDLYRIFKDQVSNLKDVRSVFYPKLNHMYIAFPNSDTPQILVYDPDIGNVVGRYQDVNVYSWLLREDGTLLSGGAGYAYTFDFGTDDDGSAIEFAVEVPFLWWGDLERFKAPREFECPIESDKDLTLQVDWWFADDPTGEKTFTKQITVEANESLWQVAKWQVAKWRGAGTDVVRTFDLIHRGRLMAMKLSHSTQDAIVTIPWWIVRMFLEGRQ